MYNNFYKKIILIVSVIIAIAILVSFSNVLKPFYSRSSKHGKKEAIRVEHPDYTIVFPQDKVNRIDLIFKLSDWVKMQNNLKANFGEQRDSLMQGFMPPPMGEGDSIQHPNHYRFQMPPGGPPKFDGRNDSTYHHKQPPQGGGVSRDFSPIYVPCTCLFEGEKWENVGFRFKGNSSLMMTWMRGIKKLPFRLDFNKFKDSLPQTKYQSFYGFKKLSFSSNNNDRTLLREKITSDIFRESGVRTAQTAFYAVYIDYGKGPIYFGLYTMVEIVEDTMLKTQFGDSTGSCYKPEGRSATFRGMFDKQSFEKKNNKEKKDWSDVENFIKALNSDERKSRPEQWRSDLESVFDVPNFLKWLAINTTIQNWDSYGIVPHNFYLFHNTSSNKLVWIPWDHNEAMEGRGRGLSISLKDVTEEWPLIKYLMDQPEYQVMYKNAMSAFIINTFSSDCMIKRIDHFKNMITPFVVKEQKGYTFLNSIDDFNESINQLKKHIEKRNQIAKDYLGFQK